MPGITGIMSRRPINALKHDVERMTGTMRHDLSYSFGTYANEQLGLSIGWVVHRGAFSDCNPIWNEQGDQCLIFSGEEFCDESRLQSMRRPGEASAGNDARYLLRWYETQGPSFLAELNGCFSGVIVDLRKHQALLFNDRFGLGRLYVHDSGDDLWFSSEAKAILEVCPSTRAIDSTALIEFATCGCVLQGRTLFHGVSLMPPSSLWMIDAARVQHRATYFTPDGWEHQERLSVADFQRELSDVFERILPKYFRGLRGIAMSLTGGLDGRMIMAGRHDEPGELPCYTFGGQYRDCTDVTIARRVAAACGQSHNVISVDDSFFPQFSRLAEDAIYLSDGAMDVTGSVELFVNRKASAIAPIRLTGNYGSEVLRYNIAFKPQPPSPEFFTTDFIALTGKAASTYQEEAWIHPMTLIAFKQVPWHHHSRLAIEQSQLTMRSPYLDNELVALAYRAPAGAERSKNPALRFIAARRPDLARIPTDRGLAYPPIPLITRLHHLYQELTFRSEYAYDYGMPQWLARIDHSLAMLHLEKLFLGRHKFYHFRVWYRDNLQDVLQDVLLSPRAQQRPHIAGCRIERLISEHISGIRNHTSALHQLLSIELIYRKLIDRD